VTDGQITNQQLYEAQRDTEKQIGGLALQVATLVVELRGVGERFDSGSEKMRDHESRIRVLEAAVPERLEVRVTALERLAWKLIGAFGAVQAVALFAEWLIGVHR
jgi:hypothetical protein